MRQLLLVLLLTLCALQARAQGRHYDLEAWTDAAAAILPAKPEKWRGVIGIGVGGATTFLGSDNYEVKPLAIAEIEYRGTIFASTRKGIGFYAYNKGSVRLGLRTTFDFGRKSSDDGYLSGLPDIEPGIEIGALAEYYSGAFRIRGDMRQEVADGHGGFLASAELAYGGRWSKNVSVIVGGDLTLMSDAYAESYFTVKSQDARPGRPAYSAAAGLRDVGLFAQAIYDISQEVFLTLDLRANLLLLDAADSPISQNDPQFFGGAMIGYRF